MQARFRIEAVIEVFQIKIVHHIAALIEYIF